MREVDGAVEFREPVSASRTPGSPGPNGEATFSSSALRAAAAWSPGSISGASRETQLPSRSPTKLRTRSRSEAARTASSTWMDGSHESASARSPAARSERQSKVALGESLGGWRQRRRTGVPAKTGLGETTIPSGPLLAPSRRKDLGLLGSDAARTPGPRPLLQFRFGGGGGADRTMRSPSTRNVPNQVVTTARAIVAPLTLGREARAA